MAFDTLLRDLIFLEVLDGLDEEVMVFDLRGGWAQRWPVNNMQAHLEWLLSRDVVARADSHEQ